MNHAVHSAMGLFQEEPDEPDGPALFQAESDRVDWFPLQDEGDEPDDRFFAFSTITTIVHTTNLSKMKMMKQTVTQIHLAV